MVEITAAAVRALRERTDLPMMDCKKALTEAEGDEERAVIILKDSHKKIMDKRKDNVVSEGRFRTLVSDDGMIGAVVEIQCESAPVAKSEDLVFFADQCVKQLLAGPGASNAEELLAQPCPDRAGMTLADLHGEVTNKIREKIVVNRVLRVKGPVGAYVHHDGKTAVLFQAEGKNATHDVLKDVAMQVAAMPTKVTLPSELDASVVEAERKKLTDEATASGKPASIVDKIVDGRMRTFFVEQGVLVEQPFVKEESKSVGKVLADAGLTAVGYTRLVLGVDG